MSNLVEFIFAGMTYYVRFMGYNRWPAPSFQPIGPDTVQQELPAYERGRVYRLNLLDLPTSTETWPEFIVVRSTSYPINKEPSQPSMLVEIFVVLLVEWQEFVEPFQSSTLN